MIEEALKKAGYREVPMMSESRYFKHKEKPQIKINFKDKSITTLLPNGRVKNKSNYSSEEQFEQNLYNLIE